MRHWLSGLLLVSGMLPVLTACDNRDGTPLAPAAPPPAAAPNDRLIGDTEVFAQIPEPGSPEGVAVRDGVVYVGTHTSVLGNEGAGPSKIFIYDLVSRQRTGEIVVEGQDLTVTHGILAMTFGPDGRLYVIDANPGRLLAFDLSRSPPAQSTYASIPDLKPCASNPVPCSPTLMDQPTFANYVAFDPAGNAYVTDIQAATLFRVRPGQPAQAEAEVWYQDARFDSLFGLNGIALDPTETKLYFALTSSQAPATPAQGIIYTLPLKEQPTAADLEVFFTYPEPVTGPDGIAFGQSGRLYVALAGSNQISILDPDGSEVLRFPSPIDNQSQPAPYDAPASIAFDGRGSLLVTNHSFFADNPDHWVVFDVWVGDTALSQIP